MKKFIAIAALAVCATAAQALTTSWTETTVAEGKTISLGTGTDWAGYTGNFSVAVVFTLDTAPTSETANNVFKMLSDDLRVGLGSGKSSGVYYGWGSQGTTDDPAFWTSGGSNKQPAKLATFNTGDTPNVFGISVERGSNGSVYVNYYVNGVYLAGADSGVKWSSGHGTFSFDEIIFGSLVDVGSEVYLVKDLATAADFAALPEPGVMALLALGVGAIALKRKVA